MLVIEEIQLKHLYLQSFNNPMFSAGSRFWQGGTFEVVKTTGTTASDPESTSVRGGLEVIIPNDLRGVAYIQVEVKSVPGKPL